jgi:hypothetical protein
MSEKEKMMIPGHSPAAFVGGMRVGKSHHPVSLAEIKSHEKGPRHVKENVETNK